ncbi:carboxypeptidase Q [Folsomia candida]|uniref:carboxypeptidase Q n=1 Tax=Folsomia candida TaxID=158441 RepID=UPI000B902CBF|nr:carboxypeptidase Q [Folsomia candida]
MELRIPFVILVATFVLVNGTMRFKPAYDVKFKPGLDEEIRQRQAENCDALMATRPELVAEIQSHQAVADQIIEYVMNGALKGKTYDEVHDLVDKHPVRFSGYQNLEDSIDYTLNRMENIHGLENVRGEQVLVPHWVRGEERAEMLAPWKKTLSILGLGTTIGTSTDGITGDVLVVISFEDLAAKQAQVPGKIVVFNQAWVDYSSGYIYRNQGASQASQYGAIASLIRSVAPFSLDTPHTGGQNYWSNVTHIPSACITIEDAELMYRLQQKGERITVSLKMLDYNLPLTTSRNVIGEIVGSSKPDEFVAVSGHIDSWDLGQGVMDDAGGCMISVMALAAIKALNLRPTRTLQTILWTSEEPGLWGVEDFVKQHMDILINYSAVFESDSGTFDPLGLDFAGSELAGCIVNEVLKLTASINTTTYQRFPSVSSDIGRLIDQGVPGLSLNNANDMYFWYHHTTADTITMADPIELDKGTALWAVSSFVLANLTEKLPRDPPAP